MVKIHLGQILTLVFLKGPFILGPLFFLLHIHDLTENWDWNRKLFADNTSLFSIVNNGAQSNSQLSSDLTKTNDWAYKWKMRFNPDYTKPAHEIVFSCKRSETHHLLLMTNNVPFKRVLNTFKRVPKHLGVILRLKLDLMNILTPCCPRLITW